MTIIDAELDELFRSSVLHCISDTHFSHARILEYEPRPFASVEEMDEALIENWNRAVRPHDVVIHTGDLAMGPLAHSLALTERLNGHRFLVPGNHDRVSSVYDHGKQVERFRPVYEARGWTILPENVMMQLGGRDVLVSHFPHQGDHTENDRHVAARPVDDGLPLIHGHIHGVRRIDGRMFNVGVEVNDYTPVHQDVLIEWIDSLT